MSICQTAWRHCCWDPQNLPATKLCCFQRAMGFFLTIEVLHPPERSLKKEGKFFELQTDPIG